MTIKGSKFDSGTVENTRTAVTNSTASVRACSVIFEYFSDPYLHVRATVFM